MLHMTFMLSVSKPTSTKNVYNKMKITLYLVPRQNLEHLVCETFKTVACVSFKEVGFVSLNIRLKLNWNRGRCGFKAICECYLYIERKLSVLNED